MTSAGLWVVLIWVAIMGSRPVSLWFNAGVEVGSPEDYLEGSTFDRNVYVFLIISGLVILWKRRLYCSNILNSNRWVIAFIFYCGFSVIWSDYPFVSFKRWTKEFGNLIMVLILLTEKSDVKATEAVFFRFACLAIPFSVVFNKYFPEISRSYNRWTGVPSYNGITGSKNELGIVLVVCGLFLAWEYIEKYKNGERRIYIIDVLGRIILCVMLLWLLALARSSTAVVCLIFGIGILLLTRLPVAHRHLVKNLGKISLAFIIIIIFYYSIILNTVAGVVGRDDTLTGRTFLWADLIIIPINPMIGTGYKSFWLSQYVAELWSKYYFKPNQAHNGYLETYLNLGIVGLVILLGIIISTGNKLKRNMLSGKRFGIFIFSFLVIIIIYNITEAMFGGLNLLWFIMLISSMIHLSENNISM